MSCYLSPGLKMSYGRLHSAQLDGVVVLEPHGPCVTCVQLFLGDTNRAISETPMNLASSRSHCIFSLHIAARQVCCPGLGQHVCQLSPSSCKPREESCPPPSFAQGR